MAGKNDLPRKAADKEPLNDDLTFEIELIKQVEINVDCILMLVERYREKYGDGEDKEIRTEIGRAVDASPSLRNKKDLIEAFVDTVTLDTAIDAEWKRSIEQRCCEELAAIIAEENLRPEPTAKFADSAFRDGYLRTTGTQIAKVLPPTSRFTADRQREQKKDRVIEKLSAFFERYFGLGGRTVEDAG